MIAAFAADRHAAGAARSSPPSVTVLEVGAGSGRFSHGLIRSLREIATSEGALDFRLIATDFAPANLEAWRASGAFDEEIAKGSVTFGRFDADAGGAVTAPDGAVLASADRPATPLVLVGNYLLDTLRHDIFRVAGGVLQEGRVALASETERDPAEPGFLDHVKFQRSFHPIEGAYYGDPALDGVLEAYRGTLDDTIVLIPIGAIRCLEAVGAMTPGPLLALLGDKGYRTPQEIKRYNKMRLVVHGGGFSVSVNFDALARYAALKSGRAMMSRDWERRFVVAGLALGPEAGRLALTERAFAREMATFSPRDVAGLNKQLGRIGGSLPLPAMLYLIKLGNWDGATFARLSRHIAARAPRADEDTRAALIETLKRVAANHYPLGMTRDVPHRIGLVYEAIGRLEDALRCYRQSNAERGEHHLNRYRAARCLEALGERAAARAEAEACLALRPGHRGAERLLARMSTDG